MNQLIEIAFSGFWQFIGVLIILNGAMHYLVNAWARLLRMMTVRKHGWPPPHIDADGDWKTDK
jgi:hypothetical protein